MPQGHKFRLSRKAAQLSFILRLVVELSRTLVRPGAWTAPLFPSVAASSGRQCRVATL